MLYCRGHDPVFGKVWKMNFKSCAIVLWVCCLSVPVISSDIYGQDDDDIIVRFDSVVDEPGDYLGETEDGKVAIVVIKELRKKNKTDAAVTGEMIIGGRSHSISGTIVTTAQRTAIYYPVLGAQLSASSGLADAPGPDYTLSGSRNDIYAHGTEDGKITSFFHGTGFYEWNEETRCYENNEGFDKFTFWSNGDGTYRYEHTYVSWGGGGGTHSSGTASPAGG